MNREAVKEVLDQLFSHLERLDTQTAAILQFLHEKKRVTDKQLAPYLEQAGNASNVRWRAARVRIDYLLSGAETEKEPKVEKKAEAAGEKVEKKPEAAGEPKAESAVAKKPDAERSEPSSTARPPAANASSAEPESTNAASTAAAVEPEQEAPPEKKQAQPTEGTQAGKNKSEGPDAKGGIPKQIEAKNLDATPLDSRQPSAVSSEPASDAEENPGGSKAA